MMHAHTRPLLALLGHKWQANNTVYLFNHVLYYNVTKKPNGQAHANNLLEDLC